MSKFGSRESFFPLYDREAQGPDGFLQLKSIIPGGLGIFIKEVIQLFC